AAAPERYDAGRVALLPGTWRSDCAGRGGRRALEGGGGGGTSGDVGLRSRAVAGRRARGTAGAARSRVDASVECLRVSAQENRRNSDAERPAFPVRRGAR